MCWRRHEHELNIPERILVLLVEIYNITVQRLDLLLVWNNSRPGPEHGSDRFPLTAAIYLVSARCSNRQDVCQGLSFVGRYGQTLACLSLTNYNVSARLSVSPKSVIFLLLHST